MTIHPSIGAAIATDEDSAQQLIHHADTAMYQIKHSPGPGTSDR